MQSWTKFWIESRTRLIFIIAIYFLLAAGVAAIIYHAPFIREPHMWENSHQEFHGVQPDFFGFWFGFLQPFLVIPIALSLMPNHWISESLNRTIYFSLSLPISRRRETAARLLWFHAALGFLVFFTTFLIFTCEGLMNYPRSLAPHLFQAFLNSLAFGVVTALWFAFSTIWWDGSKATACISCLVLLLVLPVLYQKESAPMLVSLYELWIGKEWFLKGQWPWRSILFNLILIVVFCEFGIRRIEKKDF